MTDYIIVNIDESDLIIAKRPDLKEERKPDNIRNCELCGREFVPTRVDDIFCKYGNMKYGYSITKPVPADSKIHKRYCQKVWKRENGRNTVSTK